MARRSAAFERKVAAWCLASERRILAVRNESVERLVEEIQTPVGAGGNMPVKTGYLRASITSAVGGVKFKVMTPDTIVGPAGVAITHGGWSGQPIGVTLAQAGPHDSITVGWTANYARYAEARHAFMRLGLQRWPTIVREVAREAYGRNFKAVK